MGPLLARYGHFAVETAAGGDDIGRRRIDTHLQVFHALGAQLKHNGKFELHAPGRLTGKDILLDEASVTATENGVMAAALAQGTTVLRNAASEPHVQDLCRLLVQMGCPIEGIGSNLLTIHGQERLGGSEMHISPDYTEVGSYIGMGAITPGELQDRRRGSGAFAHDGDGFRGAAGCAHAPGGAASGPSRCAPCAGDRGGRSRSASGPISAARCPRSTMPPGPPSRPTS